jgi:hypothetical protein
LRFANDIGFVTNKTARLRDAGWLNGDVFLPRQSAKGPAPHVFQLTTKARTWLNTQGYSVDPRELRIRRDNPLSHTLSVNDWLICLELLTRNHASLILEQIQHEIDLKKQPFVTHIDGETLCYTPDAAAHLILTVDSKRYHYRIALEIDRGTEDQRTFREKIRALLAWKQATYPSQTLTIAVVAVCGDAQTQTPDARAKRSANLKAWTEAELKKLPDPDSAPVFRFIGINPAEIEPNHLFFAPIWTSEFDSELVSLLTLPQSLSGTVSAA